jgi:hypothetical protein
MATLREVSSAPLRRVLPRPTPMAWMILGCCIFWWTVIAALFS